MPFGFIIYITLFKLFTRLNPLEATIMFLLDRKMLVIRQEIQNCSSHYSLKPIITESQNRFDTMRKNMKLAILKFAVIYFFTQNYYKVLSSQYNLNIKQFLQRIL